MNSTPRIVIEEGRWFLNSHNSDGNGTREYEVDYRYAICYSLLNCLHPSGDGTMANVVEPLFEADAQKQGKMVLQQLQDAISQEKYWQKDHFVEAIPFTYERNGSSKTGYVIIDKANGMYPLVLYSESPGRLKAYQNALDDVSSLYENDVYPLLKNHTVADWDPTFQEATKKVPWNYGAEEQTATTVEV